MDNLFKLPVVRRGWWAPENALTAALSFGGYTRVVMQELIKQTDADGFVVAESKQIGRELVMPWQTVRDCRARLIADGVLRRTEVSTRFAWDAERLGVLVTQVLARSGPRKLRSDGNLCSHLPDEAEVALDIQALAESYVQVHYSDRRWRMVGTPPAPRLATRNIEEAKRRIRDYFGRVMAALDVSREELALVTCQRFHYSKRKQLEDCGFLFSFLPFELADLEKGVKNAILEERAKSLAKTSAPSSAEPSTYTPPPADFLQAAGLR